MGLLLIGGAICGAIGAVGLLTNVKVAKARMAPPAKVALMVGVVVTGVMVDLLIAALISGALSS